MIWYIPYVLKKLLETIYPCSCHDVTMLFFADAFKRFWTVFHHKWLNDNIHLRDFERFFKIWIGTFL